jgi:hypothetical protein
LPGSIRTLGGETLCEDQGLVFASEVGTPLNRHNLVARSFKPLLKRAGLPEIRFHDLRHTCATLLFSKGVHPKFVQELLGHATVAITLDTYSHVLPGMGNQTADAMEAALRRVVQEGGCKASLKIPDQVAIRGAAKLLNGLKKCGSSSGSDHLRVEQP